MNTQLVKILIFTVFTLTSSLAFARSNRTNQMPNNQWGCDICHTANLGLTDFGFDSFDYTENGNVVWASLAAVDSDRDGYSNGLELGDPNGTWRPGNGNPSGPTRDPDDADSNFCNDGTMQANEECEAGNLMGETCSSLGVGNGTLSCNPTTCQFDTSTCGGGVCGDNTKSQGEECEGGDLGGATCELLGYDAGILTCTSSCTFDTISCQGEPGNNGGGFSQCGDSLQTGDEDCDNFDLDEQTCQTLGYLSGSLSCTSSCAFNVSQCVGPTPEPTVETPADTTPEGQGVTGDSNVFGADPIELEGRACAVGGAGNLSPLALLLGVFFWRRR